MTVQGANVVDLEGYRKARYAAAAPAEAPAARLAFRPVVMWVPVWVMVPVMFGPWSYGN